ncbi:hypothetical protein K7432_012326 [Basidiobolus ranarum]|uniref:Uncharacterized protein n=1 Tax=Basidiobolus ranarum TaxID=34480 RepID=A0ABR2VSF3_9FUNG
MAPIQRNALFLFRNIMTSQVLLTLKQNVKPAVLTQLKETQRPAHYRKDHWTPMIAVTGFESFTHLNLLNTLVHDNIDPIKKDAEWLKKKKTVRKVEEMDQVDSRVIALCKGLNQLPKRLHNAEVPKLTLFWERPSLKDVIEKDELNWPAFVAHEKLQIIRGRNIMNDEFRVTKTAQERKSRVKPQPVNRIGDASRRMHE